MKEVELLAIWLNGAAIDLKKKNDFRKIIRLAAVHADEMYSPEDQPASDMSIPDPFNVRTILATFASAVDQDDRDRKAGEG